MSGVNRYTVGLDLGMGAEPTALAVLERRRVEPGDPPDRRRPGYSLRHLQRFAPGTGYPVVGDALFDLLESLPAPGAWLLMDYTGVGRTVARLLVQSLSDRVRGCFSFVVLTHGHALGVIPSGFQIPKAELIGTLQVLLQTRRLQIARGLPDATLLVRELENYRPKVVLGPSDTIAWRDGAHDDLLLAVALAGWAGERALPSEGRRERATVWSA